MKRTTILTAVAIAAAASLTPLAGHADDTCSANAAPSWSRYGLDEHSTRYQTDTRIDSTNIETLATAWTVTTATFGGGTIQSTPVVVDGCVFTATDSGQIAAFDLADGSVVWKTPLPVTGPSGYAGYTVGAPAVDDEHVYVTMSIGGAPELVALNRTDGTLAWQTPVSPEGDTQTGEYLNAGPVLIGDDLIFQGMAGPESVITAHGGYAILDRDGNALVREYTINQRDYDAGYRGASIWSTGAYDAASGYVFVGGGNPASKKLEHRYTNSVLKIDANPARATFGKIVDAYKGNTDQYFPGLERQPVCDAYPDVNYLNWSATCAQLDLDFGASPNLWVDANGNLLVGILQKAGIFHALYADGMEAAWTQLNGVPCVACNLSSSAVNDENVISVGAPGVMWAMSRHDGRVKWSLPLGDGLHHQSVSIANDVALTTTGTGLIVGADVATGVPVFRRSVRVEAGVSSGQTASGIAVAGDDLVMSVGTALLVMRLPAA